MRILRKEKLVKGVYYALETTIKGSQSIFVFDGLNGHNIKYKYLIYGDIIYYDSEITNINWNNFRELSINERIYFTLVFKHGKLIPDKNSYYENNEVIIPPKLMRDGYAAMTLEQKVLFKDNVDPFTGVTTKGFIIKYYNEECCGDWKKEMEKEFPFLVSIDVDLTGIDSIKLFHDTNQMMGIYGVGDYKDKSFFLSFEYDWEIKKYDGRLALIPTKK